MASNVEECGKAAGQVQSDFRFRERRLRREALDIGSKGLILLSKTSPQRRSGRRPRSHNPFLSIQKAFRILELLSAHSPRGVTEIADDSD